MLTKAVAEHRVVDVRIGQDGGMPFHVDPALAGLLLKLADGPKGFGELCRGDGASGSVMLREMGSSSEPAAPSPRGVWLRMVLMRLAEPLYVLICAQG